MFHGRIPYIFLDIKVGIHPKQAPIPISQTAQAALDQTEMIYRYVRENAMQAYIKHEAYFDKTPKLQNSNKQIVFMSYNQN